MVNHKGKLVSLIQPSGGSRHSLKWKVQFIFEGLHVAIEAGPKEKQVKTREHSVEEEEEDNYYS